MVVSTKLTPIFIKEYFMTKCLSCGHLRHDLELNCSKCGSFYSTIVDDFLTDNIQTKTKAYLATSKRIFLVLALGIVIFLAILVLFL
jgi:uncharacterized membrane protein YvbJ